MAEVKPEKANTESQDPKPKGGFIKNALVFGLPAFLVQLVIIYVLTAKFIVPATLNQALGNVKLPSKTESVQEPAKKGEEPATTEEGEAKEEHVYTIRDLIINPAGTNGQRYLLTTIGFNASSEESMKEMEKKEMALRDMLNSILTSKEMKDLIDVNKREALRQEILMRTKDLITQGKVTGIYFSKYIVQ